jgi:hypothetical protein
VKSLTTIKAIIAGATDEGLTVFYRAGVKPLADVAKMYKETPSALFRLSQGRFNVFCFFLTMCRASWLRVICL